MNDRSHTPVSPDASRDGDDLYDIAVVGGGPAGLAACTWGARYRRRVILLDAGEQRNRWTEESHGYLGAERAAPSELLRRSHDDLTSWYPNTTVVTGVRVVSAERDGSVFRLQLDDGRVHRALRIILCTGVRDLFPEIDGFEDYFGSSIFTCPSCDGYEAQDKTVVVIGEEESIEPFAVGLLDWAKSITIVSPRAFSNREQLNELGITTVVGEPASLVGDGKSLRALRLRSGQEIDCDMMFCTLEHRAQSDLAERIGCEISGEGCVLVDDDGATSVEHVYAAGDMTPGAHLVQIAAAKGATAGIAAAVSLRGERGSTSSPAPAPDADSVLSGS